MQSTQPTSLPRRRLLAGSASALTAAGLASFHSQALAQQAAAPAAKPLPAVAGWKRAEDLIVHSSTTIETKRSAFGTSVITPTDQLYVRNNLPSPPESIVADRDAWQVQRRIPTIYETCESCDLDLDRFEALFPDGYHRGALKIAGLRFVK